MKKLLVLVSTVILVFPAIVSAEGKDEDDLAAAVKTFMEFNLGKMESLSKEEQKKTSAALNNAWNTLVKGGDKAASKIEKGIEENEKSKEKNHWFALTAAGLLFEIGKAGKAQAIEKALKGADINANFQAVFMLCFSMARTRDERVLPAMRAILKSEVNKHSTFIAEHAMTIRWPLILDFTYGVYGPGAADDVLSMLESNPSDAEIKSCIYLLERFHHVKALPAIRKLAKTGSEFVKADAMFALGKYGHPEDRILVESNLKVLGKDFRQFAIAAVWEMADPESTAAIIPLLDDPEEEIAQSAGGTLVKLCKPEGIRACVKYLESGKLESVKKTIKTWAGNYGKNAMEMGPGIIGASLDNLKSDDPAKIEEVCKSYWAFKDAKYDFKPGDRKMTAEELKAAIAE